MQFWQCSKLWDRHYGILTECLLISKLFMIFRNEFLKNYWSNSFNQKYHCNDNEHQVQAQLLLCAAVAHIYNSCAGKDVERPHHLPEGLFWSYFNWCINTTLTFSRSFLYHLTTFHVTWMGLCPLSNVLPWL